MVWRRKIYLRVQDAFQFPVIIKLGAIVRRDGLDPLAFRPQQLNRPLQRLFLGGEPNERVFIGTSFKTLWLIQSK